MKNSETTIRQRDKDWRWFRLEELIEFVIGGDWGKDPSFQDGSYNLTYCIRGSEMRNWETEKGRTASLRKIKKSSIETRKLREGDILLEISGGGPDQPVGRTVLIDRSVVAWEAGTPKICTNFLRLLRPNGFSHPKYLNQYLQYFYATGKIVEYQGGSNNLRNLRFNDYVKILVPVPDKNTQNDIVSKLEELFSELDKSIEQLKTAQQQLKVYRQSVLQWAFEGKLTSQSRGMEGLTDDVEARCEIENEISAIPSSAAIRDSDRKLPEGWKWVRLQDVCKLQGGTAKGRKLHEKNTIMLPYLRVANVQDGFLDLKEVKEIEVLTTDLEKYRLVRGDVLFTEGGDKDKLGRGSIWNEEVENCIHQNHVFRGRPNRKIVSSKFISYFTQSSQAKRYFYANAKQTINLASMNLRVLSNLPFPLCTLREQQIIIQQIETRLSVADKLEETIRQSLQQAEALRQSILKQAFEGKLIQPNKEIHKPKNIYFYQAQTLAYLNHFSKEAGIAHGEMTLAKYAYLADKLFDIPTYYDYRRWHLGPYPPEIKKIVKNARFFTNKNGSLEVVESEKLFKYDYPYKKDIEDAVQKLATVFAGLPPKDRAYKTELLATVCKVIEDIQSLEIDAIRKSMEEWKIDLKTSTFKNKAEKFSKSETAECLRLIKERKWGTHLIR